MLHLEQAGSLPLYYCCVLLLLFFSNSLIFFSLFLSYSRYFSYFPLIVSFHSS